MCLHSSPVCGVITTQADTFVYTRQLCVASTQHTCNQLFPPRPPPPHLPHTCTEAPTTHLSYLYSIPRASLGCKCITSDKYVCPSKQKEVHHMPGRGPTVAGCLQSCHIRTFPYYHIHQFSFPDSVFHYQIFSKKVFSCINHLAVYMKGRERKKMAQLFKIRILP